MAGGDEEGWAKPRVEVRIVEDHSATARCDVGFLRLRRLTLENRHDDGEVSESYRYDMVDRAALDAVVIALWAQGPSGPSVYLRTALRPPLAFRRPETVPLPPDGVAVVWEVPAGLIEPDERGARGVLACAAREALEETGFDLAAEDFEILGPPMYLSPGVMAEQLHFAVARVDVAARGVPTEDGSPVEARAVVKLVPLAEALAACRGGLLGDVKTEVALRRLAEHLGGA